MELRDALVILRDDEIELAILRDTNIDLKIKSFERH